MKLNGLRMSSFIVATYILLIQLTQIILEIKETIFYLRLKKELILKQLLIYRLNIYVFLQVVFLRFTLAGSTDHFRTEIVLLSNFALVFA